jgi:formate hydrogenlyase subunit 3/multisubunit Na+/H+ antiporter MnhD subunit
MTSFSVFLSGFLVKIALFGLYKLMFLFTLFTKIIAVTLAMLSSLVTSVIFLFQMDIKKIVAYATIQEMGQLTVAAFMMHLFNIRTISMFLITHTVLSAKFFYISDVIYRQYSSRSGTVVTGLLSKSPKLSSAVVIGLVLFRGIPFTSKNSVEINLLNVLFGTDFSFGLFWLLLIIFVGNVTFSFVFLRTLVLGPIMQTGFIDLVQLDISIFILCTTILVSIPYLFF